MSIAPIDVEAARNQHRAFERALESLGCEVRHFPEAPDQPDAVFVQDAAIVFDELAVIARPGAESRRPETQSVSRALSEYRPLRFVEAPGTLDGGDVLCLGRDVYVGKSARTNVEGIRQLDAILRPHGYTVRSVEIEGCLHLQSAATPIADDVLLVNRRWVDPAVFGGQELVEIDPSEPFAANALRVGDAIVYPGSFPRTLERIRERGIRVATVDMNELAKAEGGVTCCCILVSDVVAGLE